jgi:hypothetical protein
MNKTVLLLLLALCLPAGSNLRAQASENSGFDASRYNVVWNTPAIDATASMPTGNGDLGANVYITGSGDLYLLIKADHITSLTVTPQERKKDVIIIKN